MNDHILTAHGISAWVGDREVVHDVALRLRPGELHMLMGKNGSGKSSFVNALMGHPKFSKIEGSLKLGDEELLSVPPNVKAKKGLFLSMQYLPAIDGITLAYFLHQAHKALSDTHVPIMDFYDEAKKQAKAIGIAESLLDRPLHAGLSGGEKKQSEILELLMLRPRFAFLDEIDSGVDIDALKKVWNGIETLRANGTAFVLITHYPSLLQSITPEVVHIMSQGSIIRTGNTALASDIERYGFENIINVAN
jgi:Fe-S cluster assembly ATP-binding protein